MHTQQQVDELDAVEAMEVLEVIRERTVSQYRVACRLSSQLQDTGRQRQVLALELTAIDLALDALRVRR